MPALILLLVVALMSAHLGGRHLLARRLALVSTVLVGLTVADSAALLVGASLGGERPLRFASGIPPSSRR